MEALYGLCWHTGRPTYSIQSEFSVVYRQDESGKSAISILSGMRASFVCVVGLVGECVDHERYYNLFAFTT